MFSDHNVYITFFRILFKIVGSTVLCIEVLKIYSYGTSETYFRSFIASKIYIEYALPNNITLFTISREREVFRFKTMTNDNNKLSSYSDLEQFLENITLRPVSETHWG